jgi:hypothetical protein
LTLLAPGLLLVADRAYVEPFLTAVLLLGFLLAMHGHTRLAMFTLAFAILVKEIAVLAVLPFVVQSVRARDWRQTLAWGLTVVPYALWSAWVWLRVGSLPFLAPAPTRRTALGLPLAGMHDVLSHHTADAGVIALITLLTAVLAITAGLLVRRTPLGGATLAFGVLTLCLGPDALHLEAETLRVLAVPQVFTIVAFIAAYASARRYEADTIAAASEERPRRRSMTLNRGTSAAKATTWPTSRTRWVSPG